MSEGSKTLKSMKATDELALSANAFEALERDFEIVLQELAGDEHLEKFRNEYEKLHRALLKSHENEKRLMRKCQELNAEIVANAAKVQTALKLSQEDQNIIANLKKEIEKAWKMIDASHEKEAKAKETIQALTNEIKTLSALVDHGAGLSAGHEDTVNNLLKAKEELTQQRAQQEQQIQLLKKDKNNLIEMISEYKEREKKHEENMKLLKDELNSKKIELENLKKMRKTAQESLTEKAEKLKQTEQIIKEKDVIIAQKDEEYRQLELKLKEQNLKTSVAEKEVEREKQKRLNVESVLADQIANNKKLMTNNSQLVLESQVKDRQINALKVEKSEQKKEYNKLNEKLKRLKAQKEEVEANNEALLADIKELNAKIDELNKKLEQEKQKNEHLAQENRILNKNYAKAEIDKKKQLSKLQIEKGRKENYERKLEGYREEAQEMRKETYRLEKEREKYSAKAAEATQKYYQALEEVKIKQLENTELHKKIKADAKVLKQQQALYEAVRSDRNMYSKNLHEAQEEVQEMRKKFKIVNQQIAQLKEEIATKEQALVKEHEMIEKEKQKRQQLNDENLKLKEKIEELQKYIQQIEAETQKSKQIIKEADMEQKKMQKALEQVKNDRDILGTQLIRRNDELALLYEKIKIQQSALNKGATQFQEKVAAIKTLKKKIVGLTHMCHLLKSKVGRIEILEKEIHSLQKELLNERNKVKALSEDLQNPMNVHRWRKLEGSDPTTYEMILKIQTLQKRLITKTEEVMEKDLLIQEKEKLYQELKNILARQPGPEVAQQLNAYSETLKQKTLQMKAMTSELNMWKFKYNQLKYQEARLSQEFVEARKKYFELKKKLDMMMRKSDSQIEYPVQHPPNQVQFTGGGFSLQATH